MILRETALWIVFLYYAYAQSPIALTLNNTVYFLFPNTSEFSSLDTSRTFDQKSANFTTLSKLPTGISGASVVQDRIVAYGGTCGSAFQTYVYESERWSEVSAAGTAPSYTQEGGIFALGNTTYQFGGTCSKKTGRTYSNTMGKQSNFGWTATSNTNPPVPESGFATVVQNGSRAVIVGGRAASAWVAMNQVAVFDGNAQAWTFVSTVGIAGDSRIGHSAVAASNGTIIVCGGYVVSPTQAAQPPLLRLDTNEAASFTWSNLSSSSFTDLADHAAIMLPGDLMLLYKGTEISSQNANKGVLLYDLPTASFVSSYSPPPKPSPDNANGQGLTSSQIAAISTTITLACLAGIAATAYILWRRRKRSVKRSQTASPMPSISAPPPPAMTLRRGHSITAWATEIARKASGMQPSLWDYDDDGYDDKNVVQVVYSAPRGKLRVMNPDSFVEKDEDTREARRRVFSYESKPSGEDLNVKKRARILPERDIASRHHLYEQDEEEDDDDLRPIVMDHSMPVRFV